MHEGKIGKINVARGLCYKPRFSIGPKGEYPIPPGVNWDLWLGPAPLAPLTRKRVHYDWHMQFPYGNGDLGNQGIHQMDLCRWGLGVDRLSDSVLSYGGRLGYEDAGDAANTQMIVHDYGDRALVFEVRGLTTKPYRNAGVGVIFEGSNGSVVMTSYHEAARPSTPKAMWCKVSKAAATISAISSTPCAAENTRISRPISWKGICPAPVPSRQHLVPSGHSNIGCRREGTVAKRVQPRALAGDLPAVCRTFVR